MLPTSFPHRSRFSGTRTPLLVLLCLVFAAQGSSAQDSHLFDIHGVVRDRDGQPLAAVFVRLPELDRTEFSHQDGSFHLERVPAGSWRLVAERIGYRTVETTVAVTGEGPVGMELVMEPSVLQIEGVIVTGTPRARSGADVLRPVNVLSGEALGRRLDGTLAGTLGSEPGVAATSMGPASARPVIRGLGGDRVLILEDGVRVGDVSAVSSDHATALDPLSAQRIEVVRGPAALLYGSQALGGVVNVIRDEIPRSVPHGATGTASFQGQTANHGLAGSGTIITDLRNDLVLRVEISARRAEDQGTPEGRLENTALSTYGVAGGIGLVRDRGHVGMAYRYFANDYGIPGGFVGAHAEGVDIEMSRHVLKGEGRLRDVGPFHEIEADASWTRYLHRELEQGGILGTEYGLVTHAVEVRGHHGETGSLTGGTVGVRFQHERFGYGGSLATPASRRWTASAFLHEEVRLDAFSIEGGLRYDWILADPFRDDPDASIGHIRDRRFHAVSGSLGGLYRLPSGLVLGASAARAFRAPDINELYSRGPHLASFSFEVGDPDLGTEVSAGLDAFVRLERDRGRAELTVFRNDVDGFLYPRETGEISRVQLPIYQYTGADARLEGFEGTLEWSPGSRWIAEASGSYVRGTLTDTNEPLPLIPPLQGRLGLRHETPRWFGGIELRAADDQERLGEFETPTEGYVVWGITAGMRRAVSGRLHSLTLRLDNITDRAYRNHLSRTKAIMPEAGRTLSALYRVHF
jgi:iron complex outermembrane recepter protein